MAASRLDNTAIITFLLDKKELNNLLRGRRFNDEEIDQAVQRVVDYFNEQPPYSIVTNTSSFPYRYTLLIGVSGHLLRSASINEASNQLNYSADGVSVQDKDKAEIFLRIGNMFWEEFKEKVSNIKIAANLSNAFGATPSELQYVAR